MGDVSDPAPSTVPYLNNRFHRLHGIPDKPTKSYTGYYFWTKNDIAFLRRNYERSQVLVEEIAETLGRTVNSVYLMASRLGLERPVLEEPKWE